MAASPIIDAWIQHPTPGFIGRPIFESLRRWMGIGDQVPEVPLAMTMGALDAAKVERALITAWFGPEGALIGHDEVAGWVRQHPDRLVGVASVDISRPMEAVRQLRHAVEDLGFVAVRQLPWLWQLPPDDRRYYPLYAACIDLGVPFCLQVGHTGPLMPSEFGRPIPYLDRVAFEFPELVIVAGHIGYPWTEEMISMARKYPNVYIDTSAYKPSRFPATLVDFMKSRTGRKKVLFGSNWPMIQPREALAEVDALGLDDETKRLFLGDNAARVFGL